MYGGWAYGQAWYGEGPFTFSVPVVAVLELVASTHRVSALNASASRQLEMIATKTILFEPIPASSERHMHVDGSILGAFDVDGSVG